MGGAGQGGKAEALRLARYAVRPAEREDQQSYRQDCSGGGEPGGNAVAKNQQDVGAARFQI